MKEVTVDVTLTFDLEFPDSDDPELAARQWIQTVDRVVFKDEINSGRYTVTVREATRKKTDQELATDMAKIVMDYRTGSRCVEDAVQTISNILWEDALRTVKP